MSRKRDSGQVLLIAAFIMAFLLLSAELYMFEVGRIMSEVESHSLSDFLLGVKLGSRHVAVGSLANISTGGSNDTLNLNLQRWSSIIDRQYQSGMSVLNYSLVEAAPYSSGVMIDWDTNGSGVSSVCTSFTHKLLGREGNLNCSYFINITTTLLVESSHQEMPGNGKRVYVTLNLLNEGRPALAKQVTIYYRVPGDWLIPDESNSYTVLDYGNGTLSASFVADIPSENVEVSARVYDQREIYVQANSTSTKI